MATLKGRVEPSSMTGNPKINQSCTNVPRGPRLTLTSNPAALNPETLTPLEMATSPWKVIQSDP